MAEILWLFLVFADNFFQPADTIKPHLAILSALGKTL